MAKVSVIVPVYNVEAYLRCCVDSILAQTFTDFELFLVDDGSSDKSGEICDEYAAQDARVIVLHQKNGGYRRHAMRALTGRLLTATASGSVLWIAMIGVIRSF